MIVRKGYRFRASPEAEMDADFTRAIGCDRLVSNLALSQHEMFGRKGRHLDPEKELPELKRQFPFLKTEAYSQCLQQALMDLKKAFKNFYEGRAGYPTPRRKFKHDSMRFPQPYTKQGPSIILGHNSIKLPKFGWLRIERHRKIKGRIRNVTVSKEGDQWFVVIQTEIEVKDPVVKPNLPSIGLDMGVTRPITTSTGEVIALPQMSKVELEKHKKLQRILSRRKKGKNGRHQARMKLRRFDIYITNRRNDARHKATTRLVKTHGLIGIEDLQVQNMTKSARGTVENPGKNVAQKAGLNRRMLDVSPGEVHRQLEYKGAWYGTVVESVAPHFTSQDCSACQTRNVVARADQVIECVACGLVLCRDINAARNIEHKALKAYGRRTGGDSPWIEPECRSEAGTRKAVMIAYTMQTARSPCLQAGE